MPREITKTEKKKKKKKLKKLKILQILKIAFKKLQGKKFPFV
jgi:hypothetical protein